MNNIRAVLFVLSCYFFANACLAQENRDGNKVLQQTFAPLPSHWLQSRIKEPVFDGVVHAIETGKKSHQTLILVHGLGYSGLRDWLHIIPQLEHDYHVIALDLPGFGESDSTSLQLAPKRYAELLKWLIPQFTQQKVTLIGHSMGGAISLRFASEYPSMVKRLIMVDTAGILHRSVFVRHMTQMPKRYEWSAKYQQQFRFIDSAVNKVNRLINNVSGSVLRQLDKVPDPTLVIMQNRFAQKYVYKDRPTLNAAIGLINEDFSQAIDTLSIPTHIIWGENDRVAPLRSGELLQHNLSKAELSVIQDAGHVPMKDKPIEFMQTLNYALTQPPKSNVSNTEKQDQGLQTLTCHNQNDQSYSGRYTSVNIKGCKYITLTDLYAERIIIENSDVVMRQVNVASDNVSVDINQSSVIMTNVNLQSKTAMKVSNSIVDAAGLQFVNSSVAIEVMADSLIYLSVSQHIKNGSVQYLHGISQGSSFDLE